MSCNNVLFSFYIRWNSFKFFLLFILLRMGFVYQMLTSLLGKDLMQNLSIYNNHVFHIVCVKILFWSYKGEYSFLLVIYVSTLNTALMVIYIMNIIVIKFYVIMLFLVNNILQLSWKKIIEYQTFGFNIINEFTGIQLLQFQVF